MFRSIWEDMKEMLRSGTMLTRLIVINIIVFVVIGVFIQYLFKPIYPGVLDYLALSSDIVWNLKHPWVFITHMFMHAGLYHIFWNMLLYYWFGTIVGDLVGDKKILPLFIYGGLMGAVIYLISAAFILPQQLAGHALGASAAVMATVIAAAVIAPDYKIRLILIGPISIKYIAVILLIIDLIGTTGMSNTGGHFAHLGGALFGWFFASNLKRGNDLSIGFNKFMDRILQLFQGSSAAGKTRLKVSHKSRKKTKKTSSSSKHEKDLQTRVDEILDKINEKGYDQLTEEEKEFLFIASKKQK
jgi:membrane associated rhomboid family serine protease